MCASYSSVHRLHRCSELTRCAFAGNADGRRLASGSTDKALRLWVPEKDNKSMELKGHQSEVSRIRWDPTHPERLVTCSASINANRDTGVYFWDVRQAKATAVVETDGENINMVWSPDGKTVVVGNRSDTVKWIDVDTKTVVNTIKNAKETNEAVFSHNGSVLVTPHDGDLGITAFPSGDHLHTVEVSPVATITTDLDPRGRYLAAGSNDATVTLWETEEWTCVQSINGHDDPIRSCLFSHDGNYLASTSSQSSILISEVPSGRKAQSLPTIGVCDVIAWHPNKLLLAYASEELDVGSKRPSGAFRIWGL
ncbi:hypothetical protein MNV49_000012 [Pseudohyphozyma bogoriensis]|nr:hypothetical protein MNV49_000012 [Pseudohyphozyma bogoriensis]